MNVSDCAGTIRKIKADLGEKLVILGHHYQTDDVIEHADYVGDSLELARKASQIENAEHVVFCGVYFMAESACILAAGKKVHIPDRQAGCPLADMAVLKDVLPAWERLKGTGSRVMPVTYVNSSAEIKAFCGRGKGIVCTSGNAWKILEWSFARSDKVLFMPDMNLGRNTARKMGIPDDRMALWDPALPGGGLEDEAIARARIVLWKGWCPVHWPGLSAGDVEEMRKLYPGVRVIVHPETDPATVAASDANASTAGILARVGEMKPGEALAIGTEANMVKRAALSRGDVTIVPLREVYCGDMAKITVGKLAHTLMHLDDPSSLVTVPEDIARDASIALKNMLRI
jgi:quinolinate synthase